MSRPDTYPHLDPNPYPDLRPGWPQRPRVAVAVARRAWTLVPGPVEWLIAATILVALALATQITRAAPTLPPVGQEAPATPGAAGATGSSGAPPVSQKLIARGEVQALAQARVGTLSGGVVVRVAVKAGEAVQEQQEIARVRGPAGVEVLTAPWAGTITSVPVQAGDSVAPGAAVATIGDLARLQVKTRDVDEFLIKDVAPGQPVALTVDALGGQVLRGVVRAAALQPEAGAGGDSHYPVLVDLVDWTPQMRLGMTVRVNFAPAP
jgi:multidrug efflux pump subunit AcrA (membrane-fusion protein)